MDNALSPLQAKNIKCDQMEMRKDILSARIRMELVSQKGQGKHAEGVEMNEVKM